MKVQSVVFILSVTGIMFLMSCGTYRYHHPTTNMALFHDKGEVHVSGDIGSSGASVKAAAALSDHIGFIGLYNSGLLKYRVREGELGLAYFNSNKPSGLLVAGGVGFGSNFEYTDSTYTDIAYEGDFIRPFIQLNAGVSGGEIIGGLKGDAIFSLKASRFIYDGIHLDGSEDLIRSNYTIIEPSVLIGLGSRSFRFDIYYGFPWRIAIEGLEARNNARTFPVNAGIGLRFLFGRKTGD